MGTNSDIIVIGSGIAGLTAALFAARSAKRVAVLSGDQLGGQLLNVGRIDDLPGFPGGIAGYELCPIVQEQAELAGAKFTIDTALSIATIGTQWSVHATDTGDWKASALVVATGAEIVSLEVPGEERLRGRGVSTCATCDGPLYSGKTVAVVGGGDSALLEGLELASHADKVYIVHNGVELDGQGCYRQRVKEHPGIEVLPRRTVTQIVGGDTVSGLVLRNETNGESEQLSVAGVFPYTGIRPRSELLESHVELDKDGRAVADSQLRTSARGLFVAGETRSGFSGQAASAVGDGAAAAMAAVRYLEESMPSSGMSNPESRKRI